MRAMQISTAAEMKRDRSRPVHKCQALTVHRQRQQHTKSALAPGANQFSYAKSNESGARSHERCGKQRKFPKFQIPVSKPGGALRIAVSPNRHQLLMLRPHGGTRLARSSSPAGRGRAGGSCRRHATGSSCRSPATRRTWPHGLTLGCPRARHLLRRRALQASSTVNGEPARS